jgi:hypothetical protein
MPTHTIAPNSIDVIPDKYSVSVVVLELTSTQAIAAVTGHQLLDVNH